MNLKNITGFLFVLMIPATALLLAYSSNPNSSLTGGFGEQTCVQCHNDFQLNEGRTHGGVFYLEGIPKFYNPGSIYPITIIIGQPGLKRWGYEFSVRYSDSGNQAGRIVSLDSRTKIKTEGKIQYASHTRASTDTLYSSGPVKFSINWIAPKPAKGNVLINATGLAGNSDKKTSGDFVYTASGFTSLEEQNDHSLLAQNNETSSGKIVRRISNDSRFAHMSSPVDLKKGNIEVMIQHRFLGPIWRKGALDAGNAFGIDLGSNINLSLNYSLTDRFSLAVERERLDKRIGISGTFELVTQKEFPLKASVRGGIEGARNFTDHHTGFVEAPISVDYRAFRFTTAPIIIFNSRYDAEINVRPNSVNGKENHTFALGMGTDIALNRRISLFGEYIPRFAGYGGFDHNRASLAGGLKIRTKSHVFNILITNNRFMSPTRYAVNATTTEYALGFNIYRRVGR